MAKLRGKEKESFLARMAKGRKKAARASGNPKKRKTKKNAARPSNKRKAPNQQRRSAKPRRPPTPRKQANSGKKRIRRNSGLDQAEAKFEEFHQKAPGKIVEYETLVRYPENFAELGKLIELRFALDSANPDFPLTNFGACQAVATPDGANIYFLGGDQSVNLGDLDIASDKDFVELGSCTYICYFTVKGFHDWVPTRYWHRFGEEDGIQPVLCYDRLNKALFLMGGNYRVRPEGIVN
jgi:hypothetical protein